VKTSGSYSFFSGHAANSMAVATFIYLVMKPHFKYLFLLFLWPLVFAYSHLSGLHYPIDILCGYLFGIFQDTPSIKRISISKKSIFSLALELLPLYISILYYKIIFQLQ
jgi:undecaprenyl-diphosphatase